MPVQVTYPGVYVEEIPSGGGAVTAVSTSSTAFVDFFARGPVDRAVQVNSFTELERTYGGLHRRSEASYGLLQYFNNGGQVAWIVRVGDGEARTARIEVPVKTPTRDEIAALAKEAADRAKQAAAAAKKALDQELPYLAAETVVSETLAAADATRDAAQAARDASAVLGVLVEIERAQSGDVAAETKKAAEAASAAADSAAGRAEDARKAVDKAAAADPGAPDAATGIEDAALAASDAAEEAAEAAEGAAAAAAIAAKENRDAATGPKLVIEAANPGLWGNQVRIAIANDRPRCERFTLAIEEIAHSSGIQRVVSTELYHRLSLDTADPRCAPKVVNANSSLISIRYEGPQVTGAHPEDVEKRGGQLSGGTDGGLARGPELTGKMRAALDEIAPFIFNILCLPATANLSPGEARAALADALTYCAEKRAFMIVDVPPTVNDPEKMRKWMQDHGGAAQYNAAVYFPRLVIADPLEEFRDRDVGPSGTMAGVYARTDRQRGVWKAPAGIGAVLQGARVSRKLTDDLNGTLNPLGINVLRSFPVYGNISWGARTMAGADQIGSEWKYINVRRLADFIEQSLFQSLKFAVFEPNGEPLWSRIRLLVGSFLAGLFADGAFQGSTPAAAFFVRCDASTTTQTDVELGIVNILVGFAPVKPAEFVVLRMQQLAGQAAA